MNNRVNIDSFKRDMIGHSETITLSLVRKYQREGTIILFCNLNQKGPTWFPTVVTILGELRVVEDTGYAQCFGSSHLAELYMRTKGNWQGPFEIIENSNVNLLAVPIRGNI